MATPASFCYYAPDRASSQQTQQVSAARQMQQLFSPQYEWLWTLALGAALFYPVRQLIWAMSVRREERKLGQPTDENRRQALKRRAAFTSFLLCFIFSIAYVHVMFRNFFASP